MCGITGFWQFKHKSKNLEQIVTHMALQLQNRGPDSSDNWVDAPTGIALGHRRLAIVDLSPAGRQPMASSSGRFMMTYNGELYNTEDLRKELAPLHIAFKSTSDTEVMLEAIEHWGMEAALKKFIGIFAFAAWDRQDKVLYLARDHLGVKPLYWGWQQDTLLFGSQPKSFWVHPSWQGDINHDALTAFVYLNYIPAPHSIFQNIYHLEPGHFLKVSGLHAVEKTCYWDLSQVATAGMTNPVQGSSTEIKQDLKALLQDAVKRQMMADVPLGAFLSGGIDSSLIVSLMQEQSASPVKTFSIGFTEDEYNEAPHAKAVAQHLKTDHHELYLSSQQALDIIPSIPEWCDEPFADVSQIPTYLVSQLARKHVTVSLSGDGGDEVFAGYNRYMFGVNFSKAIGRTPAALRKGAAHLIQSIPPHQWDKANALLPKKYKLPALGDKLHKGSQLLTSSSPQDLYAQLLTYWPDPEELVRNGKLPDVFPQVPKSLDSLQHIVEQRQFCDMLLYMPHDILTKVDRASMQHSLEARVPLLDHRIVEYGWRVPMEHKIRNGKGKWILREILKDYVSESLFNRPKQGFGVPIDTWLRGPLKEWASELLDPTRLAQEGFLNPEPITQRWQEHLSGTRNWQYSLWGILMFQAWWEHYRGMVRGKAT